MTEQEYINATALDAVTHAYNIVRDSNVRLTDIDPKEIQDVLATLAKWKEQLYKTIKTKG